MMKEYDFSKEKPALYTKARGYGLVTEANDTGTEFPNYPELNSGFIVRPGDQGKVLTVWQSAAAGWALKNGAGTAGEYRYIPLRFKADVPGSGNYRVTLTITAEDNMGEVLIFAGRRRLAFRGTLSGGEFSHTMIVNVTNIIPRGQTKEFADRSVDITVVAAKPRISKIRIEEYVCPTVYLAGDSTVTDQSAEYPYTPGAAYCGWGQMLPAYLDGVVVSNHAHSGLTTESFRQEGHYAIVRQTLAAGDFFLLQFGHNDQKLEHLQAAGGYRANLIRYLEEVQQAGAYPLLVTPLARNTWLASGAYNDLLKAHAQACWEVGEQMNVPVADLHGRSVEFIRNAGQEAAQMYFYPADGSHTNDFGGYRMAGLVAAEIKKACRAFLPYQVLADRITAGCGAWPPPEQMSAVVSPQSSGQPEPAFG